MMTFHLMALAVVAVIGAGVQPGSAVVQDGRDVTVRGCVERDAAARAAVYKLVTKEQIYQLEVAGNINVAAKLGHTVEATGTVSMRATPRGRDEAVLVVRALKTMSDRCS